jgi:NAD/NADP transhydrogenase alpha subunit
VTITPFEWSLILGVSGLLVAALAFLIGMIIRMFMSRMGGEAKARREGDAALAVLITEATKNLRSISEDNIREHGEFARMEAVGASHRRIYESLEEIKNTTTRIEAKMVTQEKCRERHDAIAAM